MQQLYDVIVIGASIDGIKLCQYLNKENPDFKVALVSKNFKNLTKKYKLSFTKLFTNEVIYTNYAKRLFNITLNDRSTLISKYIVVAAKRTPIINKELKAAGILYHPSELPSASKNRQLVICGTTRDTINYALQLNKKFKYIYICTETNVANNEDLLKLKEFHNIVYLPNCKIISYKLDKTKHLQEITLDTYSKIHCKDLLGAYGRQPKISGINSQFIAFDENNYAIVNDNRESIKLSNVYIIGDSLKDKSQQDIKIIGKSLLKRRN